MGEGPRPFLLFNGDYPAEWPEGFTVLDGSYLVEGRIGKETRATDDWGSFHSMYMKGFVELKPEELIEKYVTQLEASGYKAAASEVTYHEMGKDEPRIGTAQIRVENENLPFEIRIGPAFQLIAVIITDYEDIDGWTFYGINAVVPIEGNAPN